MISSSNNPPFGVPAPNSRPKRIAGYLNKIESRSLGGPIKRKYWFALSDDSPHFYWYKSKGDITPVGKLALSGAAFTFDPRQQGIFEIHYDRDAHVFETVGNKARLEWLKHLQSSRRRHYEREKADSIETDDPVSLLSHSSDSADIPSETMSESIQERSIEAEILEEQRHQKVGPMKNSTFYLSESGELNTISLQMPLMEDGENFAKSTENFLEKVADQTQSIVDDLVADPANFSSKVRFRLPTFTPKRNSCEQCKELLGIVNSVKDRCQELTDELGANQNCLLSMKRSLLSSKSQIDTLLKLSSFTQCKDQVDFILEKESKLSAMQFYYAEQKRDNQVLKDKLRTLESKNAEISSAMDAYKDSVRTKEELIMKLVDLQNDGNRQNQNEDNSKCNAVEFGEMARKSVDEPIIEDVNEMKDLLQGYQTQNQFLNQEVIELQQLVESLQTRERQLVRRNFDMEASYYQLKSKYVMVLDHVRSSSKLNAGLQPEVLRELIEDAIHRRRPPVGHGRSSPDGPSTDSLGFYLTSHMDDNSDDRRVDMLATAAQYKKKHDDIRRLDDQQHSEEYLAWLTRWDGFLVNFAEKPLSPSSELKHLVRTGVPKTYRGRVWKSLVTYLVHDTVTDLGKGYYEVLLRKSVGKNDTDFDPATKQIDLDLARTLPTNKYFDDPEAGKIESLRRVLYAYRWHNKDIGYCQGLNRLAAVALLYLNESDAFWFLVSCAEHLQPCDYYTPSLFGAVADQKVFDSIEKLAISTYAAQVLKDLLIEKLPKLAVRLRHFEVDLSLFTLGWFLTCFIDVLPHDIYLPLVDVFLYEGNKVLFRFALAVLKQCEDTILSCKTVGAVHHCLSRVDEHVKNFNITAQIAFHELNPFPTKAIETKRQHYLNQLRVQK